MERCGLFEIGILEFPFSYSSQGSAIIISPIPISHVPKGSVQEGRSPIFLSDPAPHPCHSVDHHPQLPSLILILYQLPWQNHAPKATAGQNSNHLQKIHHQGQQPYKARSGRSEEIPGEWISHNPQKNDSRPPSFQEAVGPWGEKKAMAGHG